MRKRFIAFLLATIIVFLDIGSVFANTITVLDPVMTEKNNVEITKESEDSPIRVLSPRDSNNEIVKGESNSPSILQNPLDLGARDNGEEKKNKKATENKDNKKSTNSVVELDVRKVPEKAQGKKIKKDSKPLQKNTLNTSPFSLEKREDSEKELEIKDLGLELHNQGLPPNPEEAEGDSSGVWGRDFYEVEETADGKGIKITGLSDKATSYLRSGEVENPVKDVVIPKTFNGKPVAEIGEYAFNGFELTSVVIPNTVVKIDEGAFGSNKLTEIVIPDGVTSIENYAFYYNKLRSITFPKNITSIGEYAFSNNQLEDLVIPESVKVIGNGAFEQNQLANLRLPNGLETIGDYAFQDNKLAFIELPENLITIGESSFQTNKLTSIVVPNSITEIKSWSFAANKLMSVDLGSSVERIGQGAFCNNFLSSINVPDSLKEVENDAFSNNPGNQKYNNHVVLWGSEKVERNLPSKENYLVNPKEPESDKDFKDEDFLYEELTDGTLGIKGFSLDGEQKLKKNNFKLAINFSEYNGKAITEILASSFEQKNIVSLDLNKCNDLKAIKEGAFEGNKISRINLNSSLEIIENKAFKNNNLTEINIPLTLKEIGSDAFINNVGIAGEKIVYLYTPNGLNPNNLSDSNLSHKINPNFKSQDDFFNYTKGKCGGLSITGLSSYGKKEIEKNPNTTIIIPGTNKNGELITEIGDGAFEGLNLNIDFSKNYHIKEIGDHAFFKNKIKNLDFRNMDSLIIKPYAFAHNEIENISFSEEGETFIGDFSFRDNLIKGVDTELIRTIGAGAFSNNRIENLILRDPLVSIDYFAFEQNNLTKVKIGNNITYFGGGVFGFNNRYVKIETENPIIKTEKTYRGFGHVVNPVKIVVKYIDKKTGKQILDDRILGEDLTAEGEIFILGQENIFYPEKIKGYQIKEEVKFTPDKEHYELILKYLPIPKKPLISIDGIRIVNLNEKIGEKELLSFIKAMDLNGNDITDKVVVSPKSLDTSPGGVKKVTYSVTDAYGNNSVLEVYIPVAIDWYKYPIGNGWVLGDFSYSQYDGCAMVQGFNEQGREKFKTNKDVVIPSVAPNSYATQYSELQPVTTIGSGAFSYNKLRRITIPEGVTTIGKDAFAHNQLTSVVIPEGVTTIEHGAFGYNQLTSVVIPEGVNTIGNSAFRENQLTSVVIPDGVTTIGNYAFYNNQLTKVVIGNSVATIGDYAFWVNKLTSVVIPEGVTTIGYYAFGENQLTNVVISDSVITIKAAAFQSNRLTNIVIGNSVTTIGDGAFAGNQLTSVAIPDSVTTIGDAAFSGNKLTKVLIGNSVTTIGYSAFRENQLTSVVIPDGVTTIGNNAFSSNQLKNIVIPNSVVTIGYSAFQSNQLTSVVIPEGVTSIEYGTFFHNQLKSVVIPKTVTTIGNNAFGDNQLTSVVIPDSVGIIGNGAFNRNQLTSVVIPDTVTTIEDSAFSENKLTKVLIGNSVTTIGNYAFYNNQLTKVVIGNSVATIGDSAFWNNKLTSVVIPDSVATIGDNTFANNQLTSVVIPDSVGIIGRHAFYYNQLTSVIIPSSVATIGDNTFANNQLTSVVIPEGVTTIGNYAFYSNKLKKAYIPLSLKEIGQKSFAGNLGEDNNHNVTLLTPDRTNPNNLQNESVTEQSYVFPNENATSKQWVSNYTSGHIINPLSLKVNFVSEDGKILQNSTDNRVSESQKIVFPNILGYEPGHIKETGEKISNNSKTLNSNGKNFVEWTVVYKEKEVTPIDGIILEANLTPSLSQDAYKYNIGEEQRLNIKFNITKDIPNIENPTILINIPSSISENSIKIPTNRNIKNFVVENGTIKISLQNITRNTSMEIPVLFKMNENTTPENTEFELRTALLNNNGDLIHSILKNEFSGYYDKPMFNVLAGNVENAWLNGPRDVGELGYVGNNAEKKKIENAFDFNFSGEVKTGKYQGLKRNIESYKIETSLPTYVAYDKNGNELNKIAIFKQELNEGWVLNGNNLTYEKNKLNTNNPTLPKLVLSFPDAKDYAKVALSVKTVFVPKNKGENEEVIKLQNDIEIYATGKTVADSFLYSAPYVRYNPTRKRYIYDFIKDREKAIPWEIGFIENYKNSENKNLVIEVKELDNRFEYKSITNVGEEALTFRVYKNGKTIDEFTLKPKEESKELPTGIDKIEASSEKDKIININTKFTANIKAKNPESELTLNQVRISLSGTVDTKKEKSEEIPQSAKGYDSFAVAPFEYKIESKIDSLKEGESVVAGDTVNYIVGLQNFVNGDKADKEFFMEDLNNFKQIVILPKNAQIKNIVTTQGFRESPKSRYEIVNLNDGKQAVLFTTEKLIKDAENIADIEIFITSNMRDTKHTTETYANWDNKDLAKTTEVKTPDSIKTIFGEIGSKDSLEYSIATVKAVYSEKYVKDEKGSYGLSSISYDGNIDYQLRIVNNTDSVRKNVEIIDILPFKGDNRGSQFNVFLKEPVTVTNGKVLYTTDKNPTENSNFTETYNQNVTGIKILVNTIDANTTLNINVKAKFNVPSSLDEALKITNKEVFNNFLRKDDLTNDFVDTNKVETKFMVDKASIEFYKYGLKKSIFFNNYTKKPLAGAEFELRDLDGNYIASAVSGADGKVVFNNLEAKEYIINETKAPNGYEIGNSLRVLMSDYKLVDGKIKAVLNDSMINNAPRYGNLTINKTTKNGNALEDIKFKITGTDDTNKNYSKIITTNKKGKATLTKIPEGNYRVEEVDSRNFIPADPQTFKIEQTQGDIVEPDQEINLTFVNDKVKVRINKVEYRADEEIPQDLIDVQKFNRKLIPNVQFNINGNEYITNKDGSIEVILPTDGTYQIKEISSPNKYVEDLVETAIKIGDDGKVFDEKDRHYLNDEINIPNKLKEVVAKIEINKIDNNKTSLEGAKFTITKKSSTDKLLGDFITDAQGQINKKLESGTYEIEEVLAPDGYIKDDFKKLITVPENIDGIEVLEDQSKIDTELNKDNYDVWIYEGQEIVRNIKYTVINKPIKVNVLKHESILRNVLEEDVKNYENKEGYKIIKNNNIYSVVRPLEGVKFDLYEGDTKISSHGTDKDGSIDFAGYKFKEEGNYSLVETETIEGFALNKTPIRINIKGLSKLEGFDGNINLNIENKRTTGKIVISKYDKERREVLPGQEFTLYDNTGKEVDKKVTNVIGLIEFSNLKLGSYTFKETKVDGDYLLDDKVYTANITKNNLVHVEKIFNNPSHMTVKVLKTDEDKNPIEGVAFGIFKGDTMLYGPQKTNNKGIATFYNVKVEDGLVVREISTIKGYNLNKESVEIDFNADNIDVNFTNHKAEQILPDTGTLNEAPYLTIGLILLIASIVLKKKKQTII